MSTYNIKNQENNIRSSFRTRNEINDNIYKQQTTEAE